MSSVFTYFLVSCCSEAGCRVVRRRAWVAAARDAQSETLSITDLNQAAMALVALVQSVHSVPARYLQSPEAKTELGRGFVDMLLDGWIRREQQ